MNNLLDREQVIQAIKTANIYITGMRLGKAIFSQFSEKFRSALVEAIEGVKPVEDVEVVRHGYWIALGKTEGGSRILKCSYCQRERKGVSKSNYCRDCGAKMDLQELVLDEG